MLLRRHKFLTKYQAKVEQVLDNVQMPSRHIASHVNGNGVAPISPKGNPATEVMQRLRSLVQETGPVPEVTRLNTVTRTQVYDE
jgi:hypothetical protein